MTTPTPTPETSSETPAQRREVRAAEYRRLASEANALGAASPLAHVREKHEKAAETWTALAEREERPTPTRLALA
jgi:hypothetical protein